MKPITCEQMGNLPKARVSENFPFGCSEVDFIGTFWIKSNKQRANAKLKGLYKWVINPDPELAGPRLNSILNVRQAILGLLMKSF
ncbi:hypothetical protein TNCV_2661381 [Trichonephila clavipes]|nr:hypothetical protein TNCV_2661381 [Trichonephila clavipes]